MDKATKALAKVVDDRGITVRHLSKETGIPEYTLYKSLSLQHNNTRSLRGDELIKLCKVLNLNPMTLTKPDMAYKNTAEIES